MQLSKLKEPFDTKLISWRVGATKHDKSTGIALAYIDSRDVMERLDEVCGVDGWQCRYSHAGDKTICEIGIYFDGEWIWKSNGAGDTQVEAEKGAISDAFKRAGVMWGIGRYLYNVQNVWVELKQQGRSYVIANPNDSRLVGALEKAARGIIVNEVDEKPVDKKPLDENRIKSSNKILEWENYLKSIEGSDEFYDWHADNADSLEWIKNHYFDLYEPIQKLVKEKWAQDI